MTRVQVICGFLAMAIVIVIGAWALAMRYLKKVELTKRQRMTAGMLLAVALALFFVAMPANIWVRLLGIVLAVVMFFASLYQRDPKLGERSAVGGARKEGHEARRRAAEQYMPYYKRLQQKRKRSK